MIKGRFDDTFIKKFFTLVKKKKGCWDWLASTNEGRYGGIKFNGKLFRANRVSWEIHNGLIPKGMHVLHTCDNPPCTNPKHLFVGTHAENMRDRDKKGRGVSLRGEKSGMSKLKWHEVEKIRELAKSKTLYLHEIGLKFNVTKSAVWSILHNKTWSLDSNGERK